MSESIIVSSVPVSPVRPVKRRWWWWRVSLPLGLILAIAAVAGTYLFFEPQYEASAFLEIDEIAPYIAFPPAETGISEAYFRTQIQLIKSHWILGRVVASANVKDLPEIRKQPDPIELLKKRVNVAQAGDASTFEIKYVSADPESSALVVNEVTRQYLTSQEEEAASRYRTIINSLSEQLGSRERDVRMLRRQVEAAAQKVSGEEPEQGKEEAEPKPIGKNALAELQARLIDVQVERAMLAARIKAREEEVHAAEAAMTKSDAAAKNEASKSPSSKRGDAGGSESATLAARRDELARLKVELRGCEIAEENLRSAYATQLSKSLRDREQLSGESLNLKFKKDELAKKEAVLARISDRLIALQTEQSAATRLIWHEPAKIPQVPVEAHLYRKMAVAGAAGFCFPYVAGFIALVLWNLGLLIGRLEPVLPDATDSGAASAATDPNDSAQAAQGETSPPHCT